MKTSEHLYAAAEYMSQKGHTKDQLVDTDTGAVCLVGAVIKTDKDDNAYAALRACNAYLRSGELKCVDAMDWNDAPERSGEDVILMFKTVAAQLEEEGK